jgi:hypothetical protein
VFFKDSGGVVVKVGPAHVGSAAPNATPAGSAGNSLGELWVNNSTTINGLNYFTGSAFVNLTPSGTTTVAGLVELATDAETQTGTDTIRAVTPSGLQSKVSDSISTTSSTTIASATAVKTAYDLANAALPKSGGRVTGELEIGPAGSLVFEGSTDDGFETTIAVVNPTADRTVTFPNVTGTVVTTGDTGSVTSTMILDDTIVNADINASAAIVDTKLATISTAGKVSNSATTATNANTGSAIVARDGSGNFTAGTITAALTGAASANVLKAGDTMTGALVVPLASAATPSLTFTGDLNTGIYSPAADQVAISTNGTGRLFVDASGRVGIGVTAPSSLLHLGHPTAADVRFNVSATLVGNIYASSSDFNIHAVANVPLIFNTNNTERMRLDSSGRLGLGTSSPFSVFHSSASVTGGTPSTSGTADANAITRLQGGSIGFDIGVLASGPVWLQPRSVNNLATNYSMLLCPNGGNVGIGTTSPSESLHVAGNAQVGAANASNCYIELGKGATGDRSAFIDFTGDTTYSDYGLRVIRVGGANGNSQIEHRGTGELVLNGLDTGPIVFKHLTTERARIDSSGRLLVGTSTSVANNAALQVRADVTGENAQFFKSSADAFGPVVRLTKTRGTAASPAEVNSGDGLGYIIFTGWDGATYSEGARITAEADGTWTDGGDTTDSPGRLVFSTTADGASSPTERMRIGQDGNVGVGAANSTTIRFLSKGVDSTSSNFAYQGMNSANTSLFLVRNDGAFSTGGAAQSPYNLTTGLAANVYIDANGFLYRSTSSARFKTDIETLEDSYADALLDVRPVWYRSTAPGDIAHPDWGYWGFIAEEVAEIDPRLVFWKTHKTQKDEDGNDTQVALEEPIAEGVQYDRFIPHLLNLIKRQGERIEALETKVAALEGV